MSTFLPKDSNDNSIPVMRLKDSGAHTISATTSGSARNSTGFSATTRVVSVYSNSDLYIKFGDSSVTAAASDHFFPAGVYYDFAIGGDDAAHKTHLAARAVDTNGPVYISEKE